MIERHVSAPIELSPGVASGDYQRADLIFYGVDHAQSSYEGRVYVNFAEADAATGREHPSYVGSFHIFGHGGCYGDTGHCDVPSGPRDPFDLRPPHQLTPATKVVIATDGLKRIIAAADDKSAIGVTVVAIAPGDESNEQLRFDELRLVTYR
jgi:tyrosinase